MNNAISTYIFPGVRFQYDGGNIQKPSGILEKVAEYFDLKIEEIRRKTRKEQVRLPRQIAMYLYKKNTEKTNAEIGEICGGYDHATVMHADSVVENMLETNYKSVRDDIMRLERKIAIL